MFVAIVLVVCMKLIEKFGYGKYGNITVLVDQHGYVNATFLCRKYKKDWTIGLRDLLQNHI